MYGIEPRYNEFFDITNIILKPKREIYLDTDNELQCQRATEDQRWTDPVNKSFNPYGKETANFQSMAYYMS